MVRVLGVVNFSVVCVYCQSTKCLRNYEEKNERVIRYRIKSG